MMYSTIETEAVKNALFLGCRSDARKFNEGRELKISFSKSPGFALVQLGKTMVTARTLAHLDVPSPSSPSRGQHLIKVFGPPHFKKSVIDTFQTLLRMIWQSINALEEDTLCVKIGEKVWKLVTQIVINDDDGGLVDASIAAIYASLSQIYFPSFDSSTGSLYPPSQRRTHKVAFSIKPICVTVAFINQKQESMNTEATNNNKNENVTNNEANDYDDFFEEEEEENDYSDDDSKHSRFVSSNVSIPARKKAVLKSDIISHPKKLILVDPTFIEMTSSSGYATFIFTEHNEQVYLSSKCPGSFEFIDEARSMAIEANLKWRKVIEDKIAEFNKKYSLEGLPCVGEPGDFIDYQPPQSNFENLKDPKNKARLDSMKEFDLWRCEAKEKFVVDFFKFIESASDKNDTSNDDANNGENWLQSSLIV